MGTFPGKGGCNHTSLNDGIRMPCAVRLYATQTVLVNVLIRFAKVSRLGFLRYMQLDMRVTHLRESPEIRI